MPGKIARIEVDRHACIGSAVCVDAAPGVFQLDRSNLSTVVNPEGEAEREILEAAEGCPTLAIRLYDAEGNAIYPKP